jgi:ATP-dependent DNA helicase RecQ
MPDTTTAYDPARALELLRAGCGRPGQPAEDAQFREGQEEAIAHIVEGRGRLLVVQRTGWGKSFVYFVATKLLREAGCGPTLLVSPLLALMRNQIEAAERMGVRAETINSANEGEWDAVEAAAERGEVDVLLVSPERLANERFVARMLGGPFAESALLVIDEAHCISDWGHDFRPHYRLVQRLLPRLSGDLRLLATTATANDRVMADLDDVLGPGLTTMRGGLARGSLKLQTITLRNQAERLAWLAENVARVPGSGIVYTLTKRDAERVAAWLRTRGLRAVAYTADSGDDRPRLEAALLNNEIDALVATTALGMGYDKPDLAFVFHYQLPGSVVAYYQQVGRAGRALAAAHGVLLSGDEDRDILEFFIRSAFPTKDEVAALVAALEEAPAGLSTVSLQQRLNQSGGRITKALQLLSLESPAPVVKEGTRWQLTAAELGEDFWERAERLTALREDELEQMEAYLALESGHMAFLIDALDGDPSEVTEPDVDPLPESVDPGLVQEAVEFLRRSALVIEPRKMWPAGGLSEYGLSGRIAADDQVREGRALGVWGDAGWGRAIKDGKEVDGAFAPELIEACFEMYDAWAPDPAPEWVTAVPSLRHPTLVRDFAAALAERIGVPFVEALEVARDHPPQAEMENQVHRARNVDGAFAPFPSRVLSGPVLLVDDLVDSRWTLTVSAFCLRSAGSGPVLPLSLAVRWSD